MNEEIKYAGFWSRFAASVIDSIWLYGIIYTILWFLLGSDIFSLVRDYTLTQLTFEWIIPLIVVLAFWSIKSATPGKMLFKMKIVDANTHEKVSLSRLFVRYIAYFVPILSLGFGFLCIVWDKKKQGWHDKIANTVVIKT